MVAYDSKAHDRDRLQGEAGEAETEASQETVEEGLDNGEEVVDDSLEREQETGEGADQWAETGEEGGYFICQ